MENTAMELDSGTSIITEEPSASTSNTAENITVTLRKPHTDSDNNKKVAFTEETVDNENLNRKKSKCCCIYEKQRLFGESSSEDEADDDCPDHCHGRKRFHKKPSSNHGDHDQNGENHKQQATD